MRDGEAELRFIETRGALHAQNLPAGAARDLLHYIATTR
jgi:hypothetical protein